MFFSRIVTPVVLSLAFAASAFADTYSCQEIIKNHGRTRTLGKKQLIIQELKDITNQVPYGKHYDAVYSVLVTIKPGTSRSNPSIKQFKTTAGSEDVNYQVFAQKSHGVKFTMYLDEMDASYLEETLPSGEVIETTMNCISSDYEG